jgi:hypothetical protein
MKTQVPAQIDFLPKVFQVEVLNLINEGSQPTEIYFVVSIDEYYLLTVPLQMFGKKADTDLALKILKDYMTSQELMEEGENFDYCFRAEHNVKPRKIFHEKIFCDSQELIPRLWLNYSFPVELIPVLAKAFDIANSCN